MFLTQSADDFFIQTGASTALLGVYDSGLVRSFGDGRIDDQLGVGRAASTTWTLAVSGHVEADTYTVNGVDMSKFNASVLLDGGGTYITTATQAMFRMPADAALVEVSVFADKTDTCTFTVEAATYGAYATFTDKTGGLDLTLSAAKKFSKTTLTTWNTTFSEGDIVRVTVDTTDTTQTQALVVLDFKRGD